MATGVRVSVFQRVSDSPFNAPLYKWYKEGSETEKKQGRHIVVERILSEAQLMTKLQECVS